jgi:hypothetical protein
VARKAKYPAQVLTEEDKEVIDQVAFKYAVKFYALIQKYRNPKKYAKKVVLKLLQSKKDIAILYTLTYARQSPPRYVFKPGEINQKLADDIRDSIQHDYMDMTVESEGIENYPKGFFHSRYLRENVLKTLEKEGIFINITGNKEIRRLERERRHAGKKSSSDQVKSERGGKPSAYVVTEDVEKLNKAMKKPGAIDFLYEKVIASTLAHRLAKFGILAFLHAAKMNEGALDKLIRIGASLINSNVTEKDTADFKVFFKRLQLIEDDQLEQYADNIAKSLIEDRGYYALLSIAGLLKL